MCVPVCARMHVRESLERVYVGAVHTQVHECECLYIRVYLGGYLSVWGAASSSCQYFITNFT